MPYFRWALVPVLLMVASAAQATQAYFVPLEQMAKESEVIVHGRVVAQKTSWDAEGRRAVTITQLRVVRAIEGTFPGDEVSIFQVGGTVDGKTTRVPGVVSFEVGQEIVFFGQRFKDMIVTYGIGQGTFLVQGTGAESVVVPRFGDVAWVQRKDGQWAPTGAPDASPQPLAEFVARIAAMVSTVGGAP